MKIIGLVIAAMMCGNVMAKELGNDILVKVSPEMFSNSIQMFQARLPKGTLVEDLGGGNWIHIRMPAQSVSTLSTNTILNMPGVMAATKNHIVTLNATWKVKDPIIRAQLQRMFDNGGIPGFPGGGGDGSGGGGAGGLPGLGGAPAADNPAIPTTGSGGSGADPLASKQWGMIAIGAPQAWSTTKGTSDVIVAVIDTGVDYTHEDLVDNIWHNPGEMGTDKQGHDKSSNNIDDDANGYVDDIIGWDFASNDNKPYDLTASMQDMLMSGGNPGHGTHCAGNVAARADNGKGVAGVAPGVRIMPLRFITEKGQGTTADATKAINYAVKMGARVLSNSWGGDEDGKDPDEGAMKDAITNAMNHGVLFIAAAGNGHQDQGTGYDNDNDPKPSVPASYPMDNIISVAAIDSTGALASFSNWGAKSVDIGAPGVKIFSTVTSDQKYSDTVIDIPGLITAGWDGTSMACPHVAGAAALYMSIHPGADWKQTKSAILGSAKANPSLQGKTVSGGQLDVMALSKF